jgi:6,7-dimethyl-8-ribityllumazine synthase
MTIQESQSVHQRIDQFLRTPSALKKIAKLNSVLVLSTYWYPEIISGMKASLSEFFRSLEVNEDKIHFYDVPGALELPYAARLGSSGRLVGQKNKPDMIVVLGCVQRGSTPHFDFVCSTAFDGLMDVQLHKKIPMGFGLLTVENLEQAQARLNKGFEAAQAALFMYLSQEGPLAELD